MDKLNASEAVYGFAAWITCRKQPVVFGGNNDCAPAADLVKQFCEANSLAPVTEAWPSNLIHPKD